MLKQIIQLAVFFSSFLLFSLELATGKAHLPRFGGTPAVWSICLVFFSATLFAGYMLAHFLAHPERSLLRKLFLLLATGYLCRLFYPAAGGVFIPGLPGSPVEAGSTAALLVSLCRGPGLLLLIFSTTLPLLSRLGSGVYSGKGVFSLYSLSNAGALLALFCWPLLIEPAVGLQQQEVFLRLITFGWLMLAGSALMFLRPPGESQTTSDTPPPGLRQRLAWIYVSATSNILLLAISQKVCQDVSVVPFLWVFPLAVYLLSWIIAFRPGERTAEFLPIYLATAMLPVIGLNLALQYTILFPLQVMSYILGLFCFCLMIHSQLHLQKPNVAHLTVFYLDIAFGGMLGAIFAGLLAPLIFTDYFELHAGILLFSIILLQAFLKGANQYIRRRKVTLTLLYFFVPFFLTVAAGAWMIATNEKHRLVEKTRNFFGLQRVIDQKPEDADKFRRVFFSQNTIHGLQSDPEKNRPVPNAYYGPESAVGRVITALSGKGPIRMGDVGLGIGTLTAYGRPGDYYRFYEINPDVYRMARKHFSYLCNTQASVEVIIGDGRQSLAQDADNHFDLLVLDAFLGDGIPAHLLTSEAFALYRRHLVPGGVIVVNISNLHLDLRPILAAETKTSGWAIRHLRREAQMEQGHFRNSWVVMAETEARLKELLGDDGVSLNAIEPVHWTDDHTALWPLIRWDNRVE